MLEADAKKRRQSSEKSISVLTNGDLRQKASGGKTPKKRNARKKMDYRDIEIFELLKKVFIECVYKRMLFCGGNQNPMI